LPRPSRRCYVSPASAARAVELPILEEVIGEKNLVDYTRRVRLMDRLFDGVESKLGTALREGLGLDERIEWR